MAWEIKNLRCRNCRFWWPAGDAATSDPVRDRAIIGQCRRHAPPAAIADLPDHTRHHPSWVTTKRDDWCGEHQHVNM